MQCMTMQGNHWMAFPVGIGLGCNYDFMGRCARMGGTANSDGQGPRGSGNPAEYEQRLHGAGTILTHLSSLREVP